MPVRDVRVAVIIIDFDDHLITRGISDLAKQTLSPSEVVLVTDDLQKLKANVVLGWISDCPVRWVPTLKSSRAAEWNVGTACSSTDYIAFFDPGSSQWSPSHLEELVKPFLTTSAHPLGWTFGDFDIITDRGTVLAHNMLQHVGFAHSIRDVYTFLAGKAPTFLSNSVICRKAFDAIGGFDELLTDYEDEDLFLRMFLSGYDNQFVSSSVTCRRDLYPFQQRLPGGHIVYLKKLLQRFPDEPNMKRFITRDLLAPRFFSTMMAAYKTEIADGRTDAAMNILCDLSLVTPLFRITKRPFIKAIVALSWVGFLIRLICLHVMQDMFTPTR